MFGKRQTENWKEESWSRDPKCSCSFSMKRLSISRSDRALHLSQSILQSFWWKSSPFSMVYHPYWYFYNVVVPQRSFLVFDSNAMVVVESKWINFNCTLVHLYCLFGFSSIHVHATINIILKTETHHKCNIELKRYIRAKNIFGFGQ